MAVTIIKWVLGIGLIMVLVLGGAGVFLYPRVKESLELRKGVAGTEVRTIAVEEGRLVRRVSAPGVVEPPTKVLVSARVSAEIVELPFYPGDRIKAGDVVVRLDDLEAKAALASSEARLGSDKARLEGARATYVNAVAEWERQSSLYDSADVSKSDLDAALAAKLRAASDLRASEKNVEVGEAIVRQSYESVRYTIIKSPIDGWVTRRMSEVGEIVTGTVGAQGTPIIQIADLTHMIVRTEVDESDIAEVKIGQSALVYINAYPDEVFEGSVQRIALERTTSRTGADIFEVEVALHTSEDRRLYAGLTASVEIAVETLEDILIVPSQAVIDIRVDELPEEITKDNPLVDHKKTFTRIVYTLVDGKAKATPVQTEASDLRDTAIKAGLVQGAPVIVGPYRALIALKPDALCHELEKVDDKTVESATASKADDADAVDDEEGVDSKSAAASADIASEDDAKDAS